MRYFKARYVGPRSTSRLRPPKKRERAILTVIPRDVWAAAAIAAVGIILAVVFDQSPLLCSSSSVSLCAPTLRSEIGSMTKMRLSRKPGSRSIIRRRQRQRDPLMAHSEANNAKLVLVSARQRSVLIY